MTISAIDQSIYNRKFTKNDKTSKELTFNRNFNMIRLKNYNNVEYFLNYSNNELQYILTSDTVAENFVKTAHLKILQVVNQHNGFMKQTALKLHKTKLKWVTMKIIILYI